MTNGLTPTRSALGGTAVLMACACGTSARVATLFIMGGVGATTRIVHPIILGVGAAAVVYGLWHTARRSAYLALAAFAVLALGAAITPPMVMDVKFLPWSPMEMVGAGLYVVAAAMLGYAFWTAFPSKNPAAAGTAIGGTALATGCSCCMVTGAVAGMAVTAGASTAVETLTLVAWLGAAVLAVALYRLGGLRAALWAPLGFGIVRVAGKLPLLTGKWLFHGQDMEIFPEYAIKILGSALLLYAFVAAYRAVGAAAPARAWVRRPVGVGRGSLEPVSGD